MTILGDLNQFWSFNQLGFLKNYAPVFFVKESANWVERVCLVEGADVPGFFKPRNNVTCNTAKIHEHVFCHRIRFTVINVTV